MLFTLHGHDDDDDGVGRWVRSAAPWLGAASPSSENNHHYRTDRRLLGSRTGGEEPASWVRWDG
jgi:hypothetical protein